MKNLNQAEKADLVGKLKSLSGLTDDERASLIELLNQHKKYGLVWEDKPELAEQELKTKLPILREVKERAIVNDAGAPNHILIEGDNLHALTALSYTNAGKIDVIYIDPPYNTGNKDFVYNDSYVDSEDSYRHSKWLSFMEKRLRITKQILSDRGVIIISINTIEFAQLKLLCDEIFGERNFIGHITWESTTQPTNAGSAKYGLQQKVESILLYAKIKDNVKGFNLMPVDKNLSYPHKGRFGACRLEIIEKSDAGTYNRKSMKFPIMGHYPREGKRWQIGIETAAELVARGRIEIDNGIVKKAVYPEDEMDKISFIPFWSHLEASIVGTAQNGKDELNTIMNKAMGFDTVKPITLIRKLIFHCADKSSIVLDFFAGSGTTLHATMQLNAEDGGHRQCILVTNNENGICENVTYERNKRVIDGYTTPRGEKVAGLRANNLRYYKVKAVPRDSTVKSRMRLAAGSTDLLCIMENLYQEKETFGLMTLDKRCRYFEEKGRGMLVVLDTDLIPQIVEQLKQLTPAQPVHLYVYAPSDYAFDEEFEEVADKVELYPLPQPILNAYKQWLPKQDEVMIDIPNDYQMTEEQLNETGEDFRTNEE